MSNWFIIGCAMLLACHNGGNDKSNPGVQQPDVRGTLFIIGGGSRPDGMIQEMVRLSELSQSGYGIVFTQTSAEPDTSFYYINRQLSAYTERPIIMFGDSLFSETVLDSIRKASLIYITGGDQRRFLKMVPAEARNAIADAYGSGALVGGTSAGAALLSQVMITGDQSLEKEYTPTYPWLNYNNGIYTEGLGLLDSVIVDQHFVARSRYNRIISALADTGYPYGVGIDESTALVVRPEYCTVVGDNQVLLFRRPPSFSRKNDRIGFSEMRLDSYLEGDTFRLSHEYIE